MHNKITKTRIVGKLSKKKNIFAVIGGAIAGFVNGFFGGGGGMLIVPLLNKGLNEKTKVAHATSIMIILPVALASAVMYIIHGYFEFRPTALTAIGVFAGGIIGGTLLKKLPAKAVAIIFALLMIGAGVYMVVK